MQASDGKKAFRYEEGQFVCHIYSDVVSESASADFFDDLIRCMKLRQIEDPTNGVYRGWKPVPSGSAEHQLSNLHITLLRGHRAVYYHQIKALVSCIENECKTLRPTFICLDELKIFHNFEQSKQFLCLSSRRNQPEVALEDLLRLKQSLRKAVDQFAVKLTAEDETSSTLAHCSFMHRDVDEKTDTAASEQHSISIDDMFSKSVEEYPTCSIHIKKIQLKIGKYVYEFSLFG